ncbi:MAG: hypothetical protein LBH32_13980, partial [Dysgonamonadaceae bacterium]|nr:hypothetical protein [Dysgonamonadaceae bacterium]
MAKIKGICNNFDEGCQFCLDRTVQEKEKTEPFECKGCGKSLFLKNGDDSRDGDGINGKLIAIIAGILIVLGVGGFFFIGNKNEPEPQKTEQPQPVAVSGITIDKTSLSFDA